MVEHRDCAEVDDMLPAYAINSLDDADRVRVEAHLAVCDRHEDAAAWGDVALRLGDLAPAMTPPDGLRERIIGIPSVEPEEQAPVATVEAPPPRPAPVDVPPAPVEDRDREPGRSYPLATPLRSLKLPYALVAAFAALALFFAGWTAILLAGDDGEEVAPLVATTSEGGIEASATYLEEQQVTLLRITGLTPLPEGSDYQLWATGPGAEPAPAGIVSAQGGSVLASVAGEFEEGWSFAITIEPEGGSQAPTSDPIVEVTF